jgi:tetratricopeptide (TPR) repeat protein
VLDFAAGSAPAEPLIDGAAAEELSEGESSILDALALRLPDRASANDLPILEQLFQARPNVARVREILTATLLAVAKADLAARRFVEARARLERAAQVSPADPRPYIGLHNSYAAELDWSRAEAAIRAALERDPSSAQALRALAFALFRQDRNQEAREILRPLVEAGDSEARALLARIEGGLRDEAGMTEKRLAHFHVRYDGEEHTTVGHEILRALERHYGTLKLTLGFEPQTVIPVILFSREAYYDAAGAPAWSGGVFDQLDGRIRIPIGGLTASLTPDIDDTLIHELTHAFVYDRTRGLAPRDIHEGLAQYLEGKRLERLLDQQSAAALARGQIPGVAGFYLEALAFMEYLMVQRGQSGMNDLLRLMGETGDVNRAFDEVYGRNYDGLRKAWRERFQRDTL